MSATAYSRLNFFKIVATFSSVLLSVLNVSIRVCSLLRFSAMSSSIFFDLTLKGTYHGTPVPQGKPYRAAAHRRKYANDGKHNIDKAVELLIHHVKLGVYPAKLGIHPVKLGVYTFKLFIHVLTELLHFSPKRTLPFFQPCKPFHDFPVADVRGRFYGKGRAIAENKREYDG